jgi:hypothetical protein
LSSTESGAGRLSLKKALRSNDDQFFKSTVGKPDHGISNISLNEPLILLRTAYESCNHIMVRMVVIGLLSEKPLSHGLLFLSSLN